MEVVCGYGKEGGVSGYRTRRELIEHCHSEIYEVNSTIYVEIDIYVEMWSCAMLV